MMSSAIAYSRIIMMECLAVLEYRFNLLVGPFAILSSVLIQFLLWKLILQSNNTTVINGMGLNDLMAYSLVAYSVHQLRSSWETNFEAIEDIRRGTITRYLTRPISFYWNYFSLWVGRNLGFFVIYIFLITAAGIAFPDKIFVRWWQAPLFIVAVIQALLISHSFHMILVSTNFWFSDVTSAIVGYNLFAPILMGTAIPYSFYPEWAQKILFLTPLPYNVHVPTFIARGQFTWKEAFLHLGIGFLWWVVLGLFFRGLFRKALRAYGGYGG